MFVLLMKIGIYYVKDMFYLNVTFLIPWLTEYNEN